MTRDEKRLLYCCQEESVSSQGCVCGREERSAADCSAGEACICCRMKGSSLLTAYEREKEKEKERKKREGKIENDGEKD